MSGAGGARGGSTPAAPAGPCGVRYLRLPVLDRQLHRDPQPLPVARGLGDVIAHLLGGLRDDTWRSHRARVRAESPSAAPGFFFVCGIAEHPFSRMEQHGPGTYCIPPSQDPLQLPRDSIIPPAGHASHPPFSHPGTCFHSARGVFHPSPPLPGLPPPCPRSSNSPPVPGTYQPQRSDLGGQRGRGSDLAAGAAQVNCGDSAASAAPAGPRGPRPPPAPAARHVPTLISLGSNLGGIAAADGGDGGGWRRIEHETASEAFREQRKGSGKGAGLGYTRRDLARVQEIQIAS